MEKYALLPIQQYEDLMKHNTSVPLNEPKPSWKESELMKESMKSKKAVLTPESWESEPQQEKQEEERDKQSVKEENVEEQLHTKGENKV